jgi:S-methylmethionine-dependent homocysteine/selenocysteine methylase
LENSGPALPSAHLTSTLPAEVTYQGDLTATSGSFSEANGVITWEGAVSADNPVTITYSAQVDVGLTDPTVLTNSVLIADGLGNVFERQAAVVVNGYVTYLPLIENQ